MTTTTRLPDVVPADIPGALDQMGIEYKIRGDEALALCPSPDHDDSSPSWYCNIETGKHHCWSCGFGGSFQWLVQIVQGKRAPEALAWIKTRRVRVGVETKPSPVPTVQETDLWFAGPPPQWALDEREINAGTAERMEILWDHDRNYWIFPLRDPFTDKLIGWQEKGTGEDAEIVNNYPPRVKKASTVYGYRHLKRMGEDGIVVVVENPIKAGKFDSAGMPRVVATMGASFVDYQINDLLWPLADTVIFCMDNDKAGHRRISKYIAENPYARQSVRVFNYGNVMQRNGAYIHVADDRDPKHLSYAELAWGVKHATPAYRTYFAGIDYSVE